MPQERFVKYVLTFLARFASALFLPRVFVNPILTGTVSPSSVLCEAWYHASRYDEGLQSIVP